MSLYLSFLSICGILAVCHARIHRLVIKDDTRFAFSIESFGFLDKGEMTIKSSQISAEPAGSRVGEGARRPAAPSRRRGGGGGGCQAGLPRRR
jgi:hypothetical protein